MTPEILKNVRHNMTVNILDGAFFGFGIGFASSVTVVPLFIDTLTDSTALVGVLASIQMVGWQLPQILTSRRVAGLRVYRPMVLRMTLQERWPFLGLALLALLIPTLGASAALLVAFLLLSWHALGGGFTATAWQTMVGKIIPAKRRGTFWGAQSAAANLLMALGGILAGVILTRVAYPYNFALCFGITSGLMVISLVFLAMTREPESEPLTAPTDQSFSFTRALNILRADSNLRAFLLARIFMQFGWMAVAFYTVYGVHHFDMDGGVAGVMLGAMTLTKAAANPLMGNIGDRYGHRRVFAGGAVALSASALVAMLAPSLGWLYLAFALAGVGHCALWTIAMALTLEFGPEAERPYVIGIINTLIAPATLIAPFIGGTLADVLGYNWTFGVAAVASLMAAAMLVYVVREPGSVQASALAPAEIVRSPVGD